MPRQPRVEFPGAIYHLMSRGDRREDIFLTDVDRHDFLKTLAEACEKTGWQVHAYCLMRNHFHLVAETPEPNLVEGMRWLLSTYTIRFNHRHKLFGHVFSRRYKALLVGRIVRLSSDRLRLRPSCPRWPAANRRAGVRVSMEQSSLVRCSRGASATVAAGGPVARRIWAAGRYAARPG
jgi:REP element-mobilizing transposase RayT